MKNDTPLQKKVILKIEKGVVLNGKRVVFENQPFFVAEYSRNLDFQNWTKNFNYCFLTRRKRSAKKLVGQDFFVFGVSEFSKNWSQEENKFKFQVKDVSSRKPVKIVIRFSKFLFWLWKVPKYVFLLCTLLRMCEILIL